MERQRTEPPERLDMVRRPVTLVAFEAVSRVKLRILYHQRVAGHLSHDRRCRARRAKRITADNRCLRKPAARDPPLPVDQNMPGVVGKASTARRRASIAPH